MREPTATTLARWRTARRAVLGAIVLAGAVATSTAIVRQVALSDCSHHRGVDRAYTYSGIGVVIEREDEGVVVKRVLPGAPAEGRLHAGARLVSVDGETPGSLESWASAIRGAPGTNVELEVAYPCGGQKTIAMTRDIVRMEY